MKSIKLRRPMRIALLAMVLLALIRSEGMPSIHVYQPDASETATTHETTERMASSTRSVAGSVADQHRGRYLAQGLDSDGWTQFQPSDDTNIIYVSSSEGSNYNNGLSPDAPVRTLTRAYAQLRHNYPDWMLLKRGDTFTHERLSNGRDGRWQKSGRSAEAPMVIGSYGDNPDRPKVQSGSENGFLMMGGSGTPHSVDHIAIVGIHLIAHTHDGKSSSPSGISINWQTKNLLIEDCLIERYEKNISISAPRGKASRNIIVRRNVIVDAFHKTANAQGYWNGHRTYDVLIEENIVDNNGWKWPNTHKHNLYINGPSVTVRRNTITNGSSHGLQLRHNTPPLEDDNVRKYAVENLFSRNSLAILVNGQGSDDPDGYVEARGNVILDGKDIAPDRARGAGIDLTNIASGLVAENVIANNTMSSGNTKILDMDAGGLGIHNMVIRDNIAWKWPGYLRIHGDDPEQFSNITIKRNVIQSIGSNRRVLCFSCDETIRSSIIHASQNNFYNSASPDRRVSIGGTRCSVRDWAELAGEGDASSSEIIDYHDPERTLSSYAASIGLDETHEAFVNAARQQQKGSGVGEPADGGAWNPKLSAVPVINFIRNGFGIEPIPDECSNDEPSDETAMLLP